jgi:hypothetical protein
MGTDNPDTEAENYTELLGDKAKIEVVWEDREGRAEGFS